MEAWEIVVVAISALVGGGGIAEIVRRWVGKIRNEPTVQQNVQSEFYVMWRQELERLRVEVTRLQYLVSALESEVVALGGDPMRVRLHAIREEAAARAAQIATEPVVPQPVPPGPEEAPGR